MRRIKEIWTGYQKEVVQEVVNTQDQMLDLKYNEQTKEYEVVNNVTKEVESLSDFYWRLCIPFYG